jgi:hypothetical protein
MLRPTRCNSAAPSIATAANVSGEAGRLWEFPADVRRAHKVPHSVGSAPFRFFVQGDPSRLYVA